MLDKKKASQICGAFSVTIRIMSLSQIPARQFRTSTPNETNGATTPGLSTYFSPAVHQVLASALMCIVSSVDISLCISISA